MKKSILVGGVIAALITVFMMFVSHASINLAGWYFYPAGMLAWSVKGDNFRDGAHFNMYAYAMAIFLYSLIGSTIGGVVSFIRQKKSRSWFHCYVFCLKFVVTDKPYGFCGLTSFDSEHMNRNICLFVMCLAFFACSSSKGVYVRFRNESNHDFSNVSILWEDKKHELYPIRWDHEVLSGGRGVSLRQDRHDDRWETGVTAEDYVGEEPLHPGRYSYILSIDPNAPDIYSRINIKCVKDAR